MLALQQSRRMYLTPGRFHWFYCHCCHDIPHKSRVFTFGIGSGASTALVNGLAKAGNGTAEFIKEGERMQPKVSDKYHLDCFKNIHYATPALQLVMFRSRC